MNIDSISRGIVIDHITAGRGMEIISLLNLEKLTCTVALIRNARSGKSGRKDIIKIEDNLDVNLDVLGFIDPTITVNIIDGGVIVGKKTMTSPNEVTNVVKCKNPRCITSSEQGLAHIFRRAETGEAYRCVYCELEYEHQ